MVFFAKSYDEWYDEIRVKKHSISRYTKEFIADGFLETKVIKFNNFPTVHYKLDSDKLILSLVTFCNNGKLHCATNDSDNLQLSKDSDSVQLSINRDYQRLETEITNRETPAKGNAIEVDEILTAEEGKERKDSAQKKQSNWAELAAHAKELAAADLPPGVQIESEPEFKLVKTDLTAADRLEVAKEMAAHYETEKGKGELEAMCFAAGVPVEKAAGFMGQLCAKWALKQTPFDLANWKGKTSSLSTWIQNEAKSQPKLRVATKQEPCGNDVSKLQAAGVYDGPMVSRQ